jgi:hypothetical protein
VRAFSVKTARQTIPEWGIVQEPRSFLHMLVSNARISANDGWQVRQPRRDNLLASKLYGRHLFNNGAKGHRDDRGGTARALARIWPGDCPVVRQLVGLGLAGLKHAPG